MGFQVQNKDREAYTNFNTQIIWLIRNTLLGNYKTLDKTGAVSVSPVRINNEAGFNEGYDYKSSLDRQLYIGSTRRAIAGVDEGKMAPQKLTTHMTGAISTFASTIQGQIDLIQQKASNILVFSVDPNNVNLNVDIEFIKKRLGPDYLEKLKNAQVVTFKGYAPRKSVDGRTFFQPIIFIAEAELRTLLKRMEGVYRAATLGDVRNRKPYFEAMKAMVRSLAPGMSDAEIRRLYKRVT